MIMTSLDSRLAAMDARQSKPLVLDLCCGLGGWSEAFIAQGYRAVGFDIEAHDYGNGGYPGELVLADVRCLNGAELVQRYGVPACIVASPPCQEFRGTRPSAVRTLRGLRHSRRQDKNSPATTDPDDGRTGR